MEIRQKSLEYRLWAYFGGHPDEISVEAIEVLERNAENIRRIAKSNGRLDAIVSNWIQDLFTNDDESSAEVLEAVAKDLRDRLHKSTPKSKPTSPGSCSERPTRSASQISLREYSGVGLQTVLLSKKIDCKSFTPSSNLGAALNLKPTQCLTLRVF